VKRGRGEGPAALAASSAAEGLPAARVQAAQNLGSSRIVASETEAPNILANLV
jgi:hypothetical protein